MTYKGYTGSVTYDSENRIFHGEVLALRDVITFQGTSVETLEQAFRDSIDDYLNWCEKDGVSPEKPYSGTFNVRIKPELHQRAAVAARARKMSLNRFIEKAIEDEVGMG
jgi:predicted HicB family RNase H-like nuclease